VKMTGHPVVDKIGTLNFEGHQVPHTWYEHLTYTNKRGTYTHHLGLLMLADIVYWYRPVLVKDEQTGQIIGWRKKFKADKLQRSYKALCQQLGCTDRQAREAAHFLVDKQLIDLDFRNIETSQGLTIANVMFIGCNADAIARITFSRREGGGVPEMGDTSNRDKEAVQPNSESYATELGEYTKITPEISSKTTLSPLPPAGGKERERQFGFQIQEQEVEVSATSLATPSKPTEAVAAIPVHGGGRSSAAVEPFGKRRINGLKGTECSISTDAWMESASNPNPVFVQWLYHKRKKEAVKGGEWIDVPNVKAEIRNNYMRASDLWDEFLAEAQDRFEKLQMVLTSGGKLRDGELEQIQAIAPYAQPKLVEKVFQLATTATATLSASAPTPNLAPVRPNKAEGNLETYEVYQLPPDKQYTEEELAQNRAKLAQLKQGFMSRVRMPKALPESKPSIFPSNPTVEVLQNLLLDKAIANDPTFQRSLKSWLEGEPGVVGDVNELGQIYAIERF
jgi:hypothetical protein